MARTPVRETRALDPRARAILLAAALLVLGAIVVIATRAFAAEKPAKVALAVDPAKFFDAIVKVEAQAVPGAHSSETLGQEREGSGIVIGDDGLVLTIGYLVVEANAVNVVDSKGRSLPARVVAYDNASGLALLRTLVPMHVPPIPLGNSAKVTERSPVMVVNHNGADDVTMAFVVSKRQFTGNWEYMLDQAIFTAPPTLNWSGAALVGPDGRLLGVGSLMVRDTTEDDGGLPGNMFVPIDTLKPVLADLIKNGKRAGPARPWLGIEADEVPGGRLLVSKVSPDGPAAKAGVKRGDIILGVGRDGVRSQADFYRKVWSLGSAGCEVPLRLLQGVDIAELSVHSMDRAEYYRPTAID